jgi:hypothetical protein
MSLAHNHGIRAGRRHLPPLVIAFAPVVVYMIVEVVAAGELVVR